MSFSITGKNRVSYVKDGDVTTFELDPADYGLEYGTLDDLIGGLPDENAQITRNILSGKDQSPRRDIVLLNAAAALCVETNDINAGLQQARHAIDSGAALQTLDAWIEKTKSFS